MTRFRTETALHLQKNQPRMSRAPASEPRTPACCIQQLRKSKGVLGQLGQLLLAGHVPSLHTSRTLLATSKTQNNYSTVIFNKITKITININK